MAKAPVNGRRLPTRATPFLERASHRVSQWAGTSWAFGAAFLVVVGWAISGPFFAFSNTWQLVINTGTTVVTFLMVFLIQRAQIKDAAALHLKLNEIVAALPGASNRLINVETLSEDEVRTRGHYQRLIVLARREGDLQKSHSIEEAEARHHLKQRRVARS